MRKLLKFAGYFIGMIVLIILVALLLIYSIAEERLNQVYQVTPQAISIPDDAASIERGRHLVDSILLCSQCHMQDLGGTIYEEGPLVGRIGVKNLTSGKGGIGSDLSAEDWVRVMRHGLNKEGRTLIDMPSQTYHFLSDKDLGSVIAYVRSVSPVDREIPKTQVGPIARVFLIQFPELLPANVIDHEAERPPAPAPGVTAEYGGYLANSCQICHEKNLAGANDPGGGLNLTPAGNLASWSEEEFIKTLRTGITPEGKKLDSELMPWPSVGKMTDDELKAIWMYLNTLLPVQTRQS
jgi:mono/diheme cytochrome c family protein